MEEQHIFGEFGYFQVLCHGLLVVPRIAKFTKGGRTFSYLAPKLWNSLPENVRGSDTLSLFKSRLKTHLFSQAFI